MHIGSFLWMPCYWLKVRLFTLNLRIDADSFMLLALYFSIQYIVLLSHDAAFLFSFHLLWFKIAIKFRFLLCIPNVTLDV